ncbi:MAG: UvrD-helicase domain-containing protein [Bacteroidales bacterium]|nr:UvrD-helicase domain-containing protein [Bacteroidales bacterium]
MGTGTITRYIASAGSGKTFQLAGIYLLSLFRDPKSYRNILAVTFTNKATAEMKERILHNLYLLASGQKSEYSDLIASSTGSSSERIKADASSILKNLLHDYSHFSVGTIDSFFQKVLRSFARESGLQSGFNIILDPEMLLLQAVDGLLMDAENDERLLEWLIEFGHREVLEGKSWDLKRKILSLGREIFREEYRLLQDKGYINEDKDSIKQAIDEMNEFAAVFRSGLKGLAEQALSILDSNNVEADMLYLKSRSIHKFLSEAVDNIPLGSYNAVQAAVEQGKYFSGKKPAAELEAALEAGLDSVMQSLAGEYGNNIRLYRSVRLVLDNLYTLGILNDIALKMRELLSDQNKFLLADAGDILRRIIARDQAPFIYEKVGNRYKNFMIDEFQDTSRVQWDNFLPLINNSLAEGEDSLVVGDIKQSIYRWRNSDWEIFKNIGESFHPDSYRSIALEENWRSSANIISFNNEVFRLLPARVEKELELDTGIITDVYAGSEQLDPGRFRDGFVKMKMYESEEEGKQQALEDLPDLIEEIQDRGYEAGDIGILVRTKNEGQEVINRITDYASSTDSDGRNYSFRIISQDSLLLNSSPVVVFLVSVLKYLIDKDDEINRAVMIQHYLLACSSGEIDRPLFIDKVYTVRAAEGHEADDFDSFLDSVRYLSVYEIIDRVIDYTGLHSIDSAQPYLNTLQNSVLEFAGTETNDIPAFLEWWDNEGNRRSVSSTEQSDAMQLMTIHKSKGLQFKVVLIPFISWTFRHEVPPVLWIYSDHKLLSKLGAVPVKMKKDFLDTYFEGFYKDELGRAAVDKLNMLYVAFTRARECLYANLLTGKRGKTAGSCLSDIITGEGDRRHVDLRKYWDADTATLSFGSVAAGKDPKDPGTGELTVGYPLVLDDSRLRLKLHSRSYFTAKRDGSGDRRYYGLLMHEILASVRTKSDIEDAINDYLRKGIIVREEYIEIKEKIMNALQNPDVREWFSEDVKVRNEKDILVPGGKMRRPDRIIFKKDKIIIVDFKFGNEQPGHKLQVYEYKKILGDMGYDSIEAFLWYIDPSIVVPV